MRTVWQDARYGLRMLGKAPGLTLAALVMLALGIGANTALFSVVKTVLLSALPYAEPDRLAILAANDSTTLNPVNVSYGLVQDWKQRSRSFQSIAMFRDWGPTLTGQSKPEVLRGVRVSYDFFGTLGISPALGRGFLPEEDRPDRRHVVLLSHGFWKEKFGGRADIVGSTILLGQKPFQVIGVLPAEFEPLLFSFQPLAPQVWAPIGYDASLPYACRSCQHLRSIARMRDGVNLVAARAEMNGIASQLAREFPNDYATDSSVVITPLHEAVTGKVRAALWLLLGATGLVLLIACTNLANLLLERAAARQREMAVRAALGANRLRLVRQWLTETMVLTAAGGVAGVMLAGWSVSLLSSLGAPDVPRLAQTRVDTGVLLFSVALALATAVLAGLIPALESSQVEGRTALQGAGRGSIGLGRGPWRKLLVVAEMALGFVLAISAGLLARSLDRILGVHPGFETRNLYTAAFDLIGPKYEKKVETVQFERSLLERIRNVPGVEDAAIVSTVPLGGGFDRRGFHIKDSPTTNTADAPSVDGYFVSPRYFETMRIPLQRGRFFNEADAAVAATSPVAVISESAAKQMWPGQDSLGKAIQLGGREEKKPWATIVGIVGDIRQYGLDAAPTADAYLLEAPEQSGGGNLVVRSRLPSAAIARALEEQLAALDKDVPLYGGASMEQLIAKSVAQRKFAAMLVGGFGVLALALAALGIYGVMAYQVIQRTGEIGVRMALGAHAGDILGMLMRSGAQMVLLGIGLGVIGALALTRVLRNQLYGISPTDPLTFFAVAFLLGGVALLACWIPARRATRVDPMVALRYE